MPLSILPETLVHPRIRQQFDLRCASLENTSALLSFFPLLPSLRFERRSLAQCTHLSQLPNRQGLLLPEYRAAIYLCSIQPSTAWPTLWYTRSDVFACTGCGVVAMERGIPTPGQRELFHSVVTRCSGPLQTRLSTETNRDAGGLSYGGLSRNLSRGNLVDL